MGNELEKKTLVEPVTLMEMLFYFKGSEYGAMSANGAEMLEKIMVEAKRMSDWADEVSQ